MPQRLPGMRLPMRWSDCAISSFMFALAGECLRDLLDMSAKLLRPGGRLVYFMPAAPEVYREEEIPRHPALRRIANSEQVLSTKFSRRLITMEKASLLFTGCFKIKHVVSESSLKFFRVYICGPVHQMQQAPHHHGEGEAPLPRSSFRMKAPYMSSSDLGVNSPVCSLSNPQQHCQSA